MEFWGAVYNDMKTKNPNLEQKEREMEENKKQEKAAEKESFKNQTDL
jgi:hypothetical protein